MEFDENRPIYLQIADGICEKALSGTFKPGERIPSVRDLTERGVIFNKRGIGYFLSEDAVSLIRNEEKRKFMEEELPAFCKRAELLGINLKEILK